MSDNPTPHDIVQRIAESEPVITAYQGIDICRYCLAALGWPTEDPHEDDCTYELSVAIAERNAHA